MQLKYGKKNFGFLSDSFIIPEEKEDLIETMSNEKGSFWIVKPPGKQQNIKNVLKLTITGKNNGSGIFVIDDPKDIPETDESILIQRYITNPYLIRRCKFDLRIYVLVTGKLILRLYIC